jgi:hypothetical protein
MPGYVRSKLVGPQDSNRKTTIARFLDRMHSPADQVNQEEAQDKEQTATNKHKNSGEIYRSVEEKTGQREQCAIQGGQGSHLNARL